MHLWRAGTTAGSRAASANPLLGRWTLLKPAPKGCYVTFDVQPSKIVGMDAYNEAWPSDETYGVAVPW